MILAQSEMICSDFKITNKDYILCTYSLTQNIKCNSKNFIILIN